VTDFVCVPVFGYSQTEGTVAELGGAILLECLGYSVESDRDSAYAYASLRRGHRRRSAQGAADRSLHHGLLD